MKFSWTQAAARLTTPTLVTADQDDQLVIPASGQGTEVYKLLRSHKQYHSFTAEGAQDHCAHCPQTRNQAAYDLAGRHPVTPLAADVDRKRLT